MTFFQKTILLSFVFHLLVLAAFTVTFRRNFVVPRDVFHVDLVMPEESNNGKTAPQAAEAPRPEKKEIPVQKEVRKKSGMPPVKPEAKPKSAPAQQALKPSGTNTSYASQDISDALARLAAVARIKKKVRLKQTVLVSTKSGGQAAKAMNSSNSAAAQGNPALSAVIGILQEKVRQGWYFPDIKSRNLEAVISVTILKDGTVVMGDFEKHSGNALFDQSAVRALERVRKIPPPPFEIEFGLRFIPEG